MIKYQVLGERVLVQRDKNEEKSHVLMPHNVKKKPKTGTVLGVGDKVEYVQTGDRVVFNEFAGYFLDTNLDFEESDLIVMREDEILAIEVVPNSEEVTEA
jgi:co-chaperonin GroES (HSP10)